MKANMKSTLMRKALRRVTKPIPVIGTVVLALTAAEVLRRKGILRGGFDVALDAIPFVGTAKGLIEIATGDLIPDKDRASRGDAVATKKSKAA